MYAPLAAVTVAPAQMATTVFGATPFVVVICTSPQSVSSGTGVGAPLSGLAVVLPPWLAPPFGPAPPVPAAPPVLEAPVLDAPVLEAPPVDAPVAPVVLLPTVDPPVALEPALAAPPSML